eukprot:956605_1
MDYRMDSMERKVEFICSARASTCSPCQSSGTIESIKKGTMKMEVAFRLDSEGMSPLDFLLKEYSMKRFAVCPDCYNSLQFTKLFGLDGGEKAPVENSKKRKIRDERADWYQFFAGPSILFGAPCNTNYMALQMTKLLA